MVAFIKVHSKPRLGH